MRGNLTIHFSELFRDSAVTHGIDWCYRYYCVKRGMPYWEFRFWATSLGFNKSGYYD